MEAKVYFISLGCDKNYSDSEMMIGELSAGGFAFTNEESEADVIVINTCCFVGDAKEESVNTILEAAEYKNSGSARCLVVTGCLAERYRDEVLKEIPEVDAVIGTASIGEIVRCVSRALDGRPENCFGALDSEPFSSDKRINSSGLHYAYVKIAEGCNKRCTYCIIPSLRGPYRSIPMEKLIEQSRRLVSEGVSELILVAQETTIYGSDLYGCKSLPELLRRLSEIDGVRWIRIMYCYPEEIDDDLIEAVATLPKVCHYLDVPIQHASDRILSRMGRRTSEEDLREVISRIRARIPDVAIRTTLISGFPGETQEDHEETYRFVNEMEFDRLGVFAYSREEDTPAAVFEDQVDEETARARRDELMELQQAVVADVSETLPGRVMEAVIEGSMPEEDVYVARTYRDAPDVDGYVFVPIDRDRMSGDYVSVRITGVRGYDLMGEIVE